MICEVGKKKATKNREKKKQQHDALRAWLCFLFSFCLGPICTNDTLIRSVHSCD